MELLYKGGVLPGVVHHEGRRMRGSISPYYLRVSAKDTWGLTCQDGASCVRREVCITKDKNLKRRCPRLQAAWRAARPGFKAQGHPLRLAPALDVYLV